MALGREVHPTRISSATPSTVRDVNRSIILNLVRSHQPISRVELSKRTGIFRSSVSAIVDELVSDGLLIEERAEPKGRGRVPVNLFLNSEGFQVLGISVRPLQTRVGAANLTGELRKTVSFATPRQPAAWLKETAKAIEQIAAETGRDFKQVGISAGGLVNGSTGEIILFPALPSFNGFPIARKVSELAGAKATAENDCNAGALAELWLHEAEVAGLRDFVFIQVGDLGVGSGLMLNGETYAGHDHTWVGEFGHMIIDRNGPPCNCGRSGCWELYVSDAATWRRYDSKTEFSIERFDRLIQLAQSGDRRAVTAFRSTAEYLSLGVSNITFGLNPQRIIVAGEITKVWGLIQHTLHTAFSAARVPISVCPARFPLDVLSLQGAVVLALLETFAPPKLG